MQPTPPSPPSVPAADQTPSISVKTSDGGTVTIQNAGGASPSATYEALVAQRKELRSQLDRAQDTRNEITGDLKAEDITNPDRVGLENRLKDTDARIQGIEKQLQESDALVARAASVPGAIVERPAPPRQPQYDETIAIIGSCLTIFVLAPIAIAYARRLWRRASVLPAPIPKELTDRIETMGQAVESMALEVERIGEGQRFITKVLGAKATNRVTE